MYKNYKRFYPRKQTKSTYCIEACLLPYQAAVANYHNKTRARHGSPQIDQSAKEGTTIGRQTS